MTKIILLAFALVFALSCKKNNDGGPIKQEIRNVWLSGGLAHCAEQIRLDNGQMLIVKMEDVISFKSGDKEIGRAHV